MFGRLKIDTVFHSYESRFRLYVGLKFFLIHFIFLIFSYSVVWFLICINNLFLEANGLMRLEQLKDAYFDFIMGEIIFIGPYLFVAFIVLFFTGHYIAGVLMRPFRIIGDYCEKKIKGEEPKLHSDYFCDLKTLTEFSEFFFEWANDSVEKKKLEVVTIPPAYRKIHRPILEPNFFVNFGPLIILSTVISAVALYMVMVDVHARMIEIAIHTTKYNDTVNYFMSGQKELLMNVMLYTILILIVLYVWLIFDLYSKVSGAAFAIFATMRSFMKGDYNARVHFIGFSYLREFSRAFNKYLDHLHKNYTS